MLSDDFDGRSKIEIDLPDHPRSFVSDATDDVGGGVLSPSYSIVIKTQEEQMWKRERKRSFKLEFILDSTAIKLNIKKSICPLPSILGAVPYHKRMHHILH